MKVILDTNVLVAALRSRTGASNELMKRLAYGEFSVAASTALILEYEDVLLRSGLLPHYSRSEIGAFIDSLCNIAEEAVIYFRWRPFLPDPKDDLIFECALATGAQFIVTSNLKDFPHLARFGISVMTPRDFLTKLKS